MTLAFWLLLILSTLMSNNLPIIAKNFQHVTHDPICSRTEFTQFVILSKRLELIIGLMNGWQSWGLFLLLEYCDIWNWPKSNNEYFDKKDILDSNPKFIFFPLCTLYLEKQFDLYFILLVASLPSEENHHEVAIFDFDRCYNTTIMQGEWDHWF